MHGRNACTVRLPLQHSRELWSSLLCSRRFDALHA